MEDWNEGLLVLEEWRSYRGSRWWLYMPAKAKQSFFCDWRRGREEKTHGPQVKVRLQVVISEMSKCMTLPTSELADIRNNLYLYSTTTILVGSYWTQRGKFFSIAQTWKVFFFFGFIAWWWSWCILQFAASRYHDAHTFPSPHQIIILILIHSFSFCFGLMFEKDLWLQYRATPSLRENSIFLVWPCVFVICSLIGSNDLI